MARWVFLLGNVQCVVILGSNCCGFVLVIFDCWCYVWPKMGIVIGFEVVDFGFKLFFF